MEDRLKVFELKELRDIGYNSQELSAEQASICNAVATELELTGVLIVRAEDNINEANDQFQDLLQCYFSQPAEEKDKDVRADISYQVGRTPSGVERPRILVDQALQAEMAALPEGHRGTMPTGPDVKERFLHRVGPRPTTTAFAELNATPVIPQAFPQWISVMDNLSQGLLGAAEAVLVCAARGWGLPPDSLARVMQYGPHLMAPTGSDLGAHGALGAVLAGYHSDLNLVTVHGKSRFPGLFVWLRDGRRIPVRVPPGCLLLQSGQQLEYFTGGRVKAGRHEVVVSEDTVAAIEAAKREGRSLWRISSTLFAHTASDVMLQPLGHLATEEALKAYPPIPAGLQVRRELESIALARRAAAADSDSSCSSKAPSKTSNSERSTACIGVDAF